MGRIAAWTLALMMAFSAGATVAEDGTEVRFFRIGTGSTGGTYFPIGGLIATGISHPPGSRPCEAGGSCGVPGLIAAAQSTQGSVDNVAGVAAGTLESGLVQADIAFWAYHGQGPYSRTGPIEELRAIANLYSESIHIVVRRDANIETIKDLGGKRIGLGAEESGTRVDAGIVLAAHGLTENDISGVLVGPVRGADLLRADELDAFFFVAGAPTNVITDLAESIAIDLLSIDGETAEEIIAKYPFFAPGEIPTGVYEGVGPVATLDVGAQWLTHADMDEHLVYGLARALWHPSTQRLLARGHPEGANIGIDTALDGVGIPLHPGAERYYGEVGMGLEEPAEAEAETETK